MAKALFIFDFDLTISQEHVHNLLASAIASGYINATDKDALWNYVKHVKPTGSKERWRNLFKTLLNEGHRVAIASFSGYKDILIRYLREIIGLDDVMLNSIFIESWLPDNPNRADKSKHIENVIKHFNFTANPEWVVLIDDSKINCYSARTKNYTVIEVKPGDLAGVHIDAAIALSQQLAKK